MIRPSEIMAPSKYRMRSPRPRDRPGSRASGSCGCLSVRAARSALELVGAADLYRFPAGLPRREAVPAQSYSVAQRMGELRVAAGIKPSRSLGDPLEQAICRPQEGAREGQANFSPKLLNFVAAVMTIGADGDARHRPVLPDAANQPAQVTAHLDARGPLAARRPDGLSRCRRHGSAGSSAHRNGVEQRELLMAVNDIHRVVNVERHRRGEVV